MSNTWFYRLLVPPRPALSVKEIGDIVRVAEASGFSAKNPDTGKIVTFNADMDTPDFESPPLDNLEAAMPQLNKLGTILALWKGDIDIHLGFDSMGKGHTESMERLRLQDGTSYGQISILVGDHFLRLDAPERWEVAKDVKKFFADLCVSLKAVYGYSHDEDAWENLIHEMHIHDDTSHQRKPSVLFWLNYFATEYAIRINASEVFREVGGKIEELPTGILVSFFEYPWTVDLHRLLAMNKAWRKLTRRHHLSR